jgi:hypothetical protein
MKMIKCDRCGSVNNTGDKIIVYENSTTISDCKQELDLCSSCKSQLWQFFKKLPQAVKKDTP